MQRRHRTTLLAASLGAVLLTAACSSSSSTKSSTNATPKPAAASSTGGSAVSNDWALQYTGGKAGKGAPPIGGAWRDYYRAACAYHGACSEPGLRYADEVMAQAARYGLRAR